MSRRPILFALALAVLTTGAIVWLTRSSGGADTGHAAVGEQAPAIVGTTLDGAPFDLASLVGHPVLINFWGPSCVPCRDEFPLLAAKLIQHAADGLAVVGVLTDDPPEPARDFAAQYGGSWPTVIDPTKSMKAAYRVAARPQSYFVDSGGVVRSIQIGQLTDADFERQYLRIAP
ncbi:MAG: cytochrome c biosis protein CcmG, thiol:disulfide interchange protein DsbE [Chloroflexota bacterium]|nr:cytochrome c biosis protein CcmG, thiol:disulfide interchange protein DsbE [Chloroflexota bacterium]